MLGLQTVLDRLNRIPRTPGAGSVALNGAPTLPRTLLDLSPPCDEPPVNQRPSLVVGGTAHENARLFIELWRNVFDRSSFRDFLGKIFEVSWGIFMRFPFNEFNELASDVSMDIDRISK